MYKSGLTIWYSVKDIEKTKEFYTDKLGFEVIYYDKDGGDVIMATNTKDCSIGFSGADEVVPSTSSTVFDVENIEAAVDALKDKGVEFFGEISVVPGIVKLATFADPDGHSLMLAQSIEGANC